MNDQWEKLNETLLSIRVELSTQRAQLGEHMRRTEAAEKNLELLHSRVRPLEEHVHRWAGVGKGVTVLGILAAIATALFRAFG